MTPPAPAVQPVQSFARAAHVHPLVASPFGLVSHAAICLPACGRSSAGPKCIPPPGIGKKAKTTFISEVIFKIKTRR